MPAATRGTASALGSVVRSMARGKARGGSALVPAARPIVGRDRAARHPRGRRIDSSGPRARCSRLFCSLPARRFAITRVQGPTSRVRRRLLGALAMSPLSACTTPPVPPTGAPTGRRPAPKVAPFTGNELLKSDIDAVADVHLRESMASARLLMDKLYRRNPRELRKGAATTPEAGVSRARSTRGTTGALPSFRTSAGSPRCRPRSGPTSGRPGVRVRRRPRQHDRPGLQRQERVLPHRQRSTPSASTTPRATSRSRPGSLPTRGDRTASSCCSATRCRRERAEPLVRARDRQARRLPGHARARHGATDEPDDPALHAGAGDGGLPAALAGAVGEEQRRSVTSPTNAGSVAFRQAVRFELESRQQKERGFPWRSTLRRER